MLRSLASNIKKHGSGDGTRRYISKKLWEYMTEFHLTEGEKLHAHKSKPLGQWSLATISYIRQRSPQAETQVPQIRCRVVVGVHLPDSMIERSNTQKDSG